MITTRTDVGVLDLSATQRGVLSLDDGPRLMGVLNVTPDSFSDGGRYFSIDDAVAHGLAMIEQGADLIDIGGESTRPGARVVDADVWDGVHVLVDADYDLLPLDGRVAS